jgi:hypothetical protein
MPSIFATATWNTEFYHNLQETQALGKVNLVHYVSRYKLKQSKHFNRILLFKPTTCYGLVTCDGHTDGYGKTNVLRERSQTLKFFRVLKSPWSLCCIFSLFLFFFLLVGVLRCFQFLRYIASNGMMPDEWGWTGNDFESNARSLIEALPWHVPGQTEENIT